MKQIFYSNAVEGFTMSLGARHLSPNTITDYNRTLAKFHTYLKEDMPVTDITHGHVEGFLASFPHLANKSISNYYVGLSSFWSWLVREEIVPANVVRKVQQPKVTRKEITPLKEDEVRALLAALGKSKIYTRQGATVDHALGSFERNRAMILLLLDTGIRAQELADLKIEDLDNRNHRIFVRMGKGMKERLLPFSPRTGQMIWRYLATRKDAQPGDYLFLSKLNGPVTRTKLAEMFRSLGKRANVPNVYPHRFRHTFAIQYLRNGGNVYTLQSMLGHNTLETVKIYLKLAQVDIDTVHRKASPVDNWRL
jgi:site-specific recombinase XerD